MDKITWTLTGPRGADVGEFQRFALEELAPRQEDW